VPDILIVAARRLVSDILFTNHYSLGRVHIIRQRDRNNTIRIKAVNITSSFSYLVPTQRNAFNRRKNRSTSFRLLYNSRSYSQGFLRLLLGGTTGVYPNPHAVSRVCPSSYPLSIRSLQFPSRGPTVSNKSRPDSSLSPVSRFL
jgi:hypothetical protein